MQLILQLKRDYERAIKEWIWPVVGAVFLIYFIKIIYARRKLYKVLKRIDGPKPFPIVGNIRELGFFNASISQKINTSTVFNDIRHGNASLYRKDKMFRLSVMGSPVVFLFGAEVIEPLLASSISVNKSRMYDMIKPWLGNGLLTSKSGQWKLKRKMLTPTFHFKILQDFLPIMNLHSETLVRKIRQMSTNSWIDIVPLLTYCTLDVISETAMGVKLHCQDNPDSEYAKAVHHATYCVSTRAPKPWLRLDFIYGLTKDGKLFKESVRVINDLTSKVIKEKKESKLHDIENTENEQLSKDDGVVTKKKVAFLDLLLEKHFADPTFTEKDVTDEVNTFMFGGHDTTATSLTWILYLLGLHPDVQETLYQEVNQVFGENSFRPEVTLDELRELKYMDMVIKECQRLYPSVPSVARYIDEDLKIGDKVIPKGSNVIVFIQQLHRDEDVFPNPERFDPERFSAENSQGRHPYAFLPFSAGPRNCIGQKFAMMEEKVILSHVLLNFQMRSLDQRDKVNVSPEVVLRPTDAVRVVFQSRER